MVSERMEHGTRRRIFGLILGMLAGLVYTLVSQGANRLLMPGVPLYQPPFGLWGNILLGVVIGALTGIMVAWPETGAKGVLLGSLFGALVVSAGNLLSSSAGSEMLWKAITASLIILVPIAGGLAILMALFRWLTSREELAYREGTALSTADRSLRILLPVALLLAAAGVGLFSIYRLPARTITQKMMVYIEQGRQATTAGALPAPLQPPNVDFFLQKAGVPYSLQWDKDEKNKFAIPRPLTPPSDQAIVIARFENGYLLVCMFPNTEMAPECRDFD